MITVTGEYALRAMAYMAMVEPGKYVLARDMGSELGIPPNYLGKVLQSLAREGLLESLRGRNGGFCLTRPPKKIFLFEILSAVEPMKRYETCILGRKTCCDETACPIHYTWKEARDKVLSMFRKTPLTKLVEHHQTLSDSAPAKKNPVTRLLSTTK
jgi:Rrf2 family transcriptional regulator, iron-sulfur cluster assembly transcription factor